MMLARDTDATKNMNFDRLLPRMGLTTTMQMERYVSKRFGGLDILFKVLSSNELYIEKSPTSRLLRKRQR